MGEWQPQKLARFLLARTVRDCRRGCGHCVAHKLEQTVDMETGAVLSAEVTGTDMGDTSTVMATLVAAIECA